jgi:hypothetical protein
MPLGVFSRVFSFRGLRPGRPFQRVIPFALLPLVNLSLTFAFRSFYKKKVYNWN